MSRPWNHFFSCPAVTVALALLVSPLVAEDCNENGVDDLEDIAAGTSRDCNANAIPDECDSSDGRIVFELPQIYEAYGHPGHVVIGDLDSDGIPDLVSSDHVFFRGHGDGEFDEGVFLFEGDERYSSSMNLVDLDGDGDLDLISRNNEIDKIVIAIGRGDGTVEPPQIIDVGEDPRYLVVDDLDGDVDVDAVAVADGGASLVTLENDGSANFTLTTTPVTEHSGAPHVADFDGDGILDVVLVQRGTREQRGATISVHLSSSSGEAAFYDVGEFPVDSDSGDLDGDGALDLVVVGLLSNSLTVLHGRGDGSFDPGVSHSIGRHPSNVRVADVDGDGRFDVVTSGPYINIEDIEDSADNVSVLFGNAQNGLDTAVNVDVEGDPWDLELVDLDRDGDLDIIAANQHGKSILVLETRPGHTFAAPQYVPIQRPGPIDVTYGDLDGDGDDDLVTGAHGGHWIVTLENVTSQEISEGCDLFVRGDVNSDGNVSISDLSMLQRYLFQGIAELACADAADVVDDESISICDEVELLSILFNNPGWNRRIPAPSPGLGIDPTALPSSGNSETCRSSADGDSFGCDNYDVVPPAESTDLVRIGSIPDVVPGEETLLPVYVSSDVPVEALQVVLRYDPALIDIRSGQGALDYTGTFYEPLIGKEFTIVYNEGHGRSSFTYEGPFASMTTFPDEGTAVLGLAGHLAFAGFEVSPGENIAAVNLKVRVLPTAPPESEIQLIPVGRDDSGVGPYELRTEISSLGEARFVSTLPAVEPAVLQIVGDMSYFRGDSNGDEIVNLSDVVFSLGALFAGTGPIQCEDAVDANDDGALNMSDPIFTLNFLFKSGRAPPPPFAEKGLDPTEDSLRCFWW